MTDFKEINWFCSRLGGCDNIQLHAVTYVCVTASVIPLTFKYFNYILPNEQYNAFSMQKKRVVDSISLGYLAEEKRCISYNHRLLCRNKEMWMSISRLPCKRDRKDMDPVSLGYLACRGEFSVSYFAEENRCGFCFSRLPCRREEMWIVYLSATSQKRTYVDPVMLGFLSIWFVFF